MVCFCRYKGGKIQRHLEGSRQNMASRIDQAIEEREGERRRREGKWTKRGTKRVRGQNAGLNRNQRS